MDALLEPLCSGQGLGSRAQGWAPGRSACCVPQPGGLACHRVGQLRRASFSDLRRQAQEIAAKNKVLIVLGESKRVYFFEFNRRMQPGAVGTKQNLVRTCPLHGLFEQIEATDAGSVGVDIGVTGETIN